MKVGGLFTAGYQGVYGDSSQIESSHGLDFGLNGNINGSYYNPNFLSFNIVPYFNQSQANSSFQSITGASGVTATANLFTGSHFPGSITYRDDYNSTGTFGLVGQPNFTTHGHGDGFGIAWSALLPDLPTLSVGYSQGSGSGTVYGTSQETGTDTKLFNVRSTYAIEGFHLNGFFDHNTLDAKYPAFLAGEQESVSNTSGHDFGFGANRNLPINGSFFANYNRPTASTDFLGADDTTTSYTTSTETSGVTFHPTQKLSVFSNESYTDNLSGYLNQTLINSGTVQTPISLGSGSRSLQLGGGASYQFTNFLSTQAQATYYDQYYFDKSYTGTFITGTVNYARRILDMFTFSAGVLEESNGQGSNSVGFVGNANYFHKIKGWETSGSFSYAQNVQSVLVTYTTSYYNYTARLHRRFGYGLAWIATYSGSRSGLTNQAGTDNHSEGYSTSISSRRFTRDRQLYEGDRTIDPYQCRFSGASAYARRGGKQPYPLQRGQLWWRRFRDAAASPDGFRKFQSSHQQYAQRRDQLAQQYGTRSTRSCNTISGGSVCWPGLPGSAQGISASGTPPGTANSYFIGVSRWFDFF